MSLRTSGPQERRTLKAADKWASAIDVRPHSPVLGHFVHRVLPYHPPGGQGRMRHSARTSNAELCMRRGRAYFSLGLQAAKPIVARAMSVRLHLAVESENQPRGQLDE
jgi:hypothetical protein